MGSTPTVEYLCLNNKYTGLQRQKAHLMVINRQDLGFIFIIGTEPETEILI